ncbi:MAG: hypothetical protein ACI4G0_03965 [Ruminococcus sp.]
MRNLFKQHTLKLLSFVLAVSVLFSMLSITMGSAAENTDGGDNQTFDATPTDSGIDFDLKFENGKSYDNGWINSAVIINATVREYGNISDVYYKKSSCNNETDWVAINNETLGSSLATTDEVDGKATFSFKIPSDTYSGSYDIRFKNAANITSSDFIVKNEVFSVKQDNIPPEIKIESYTEGWTNCATISGTVSDKDSGIKSIGYSLDGGRNYEDLKINNGSFSFDITDDFVGAVWFLATDNADNTHRTFKTLKVDAKAPVINEINPKEIKWTNDSAEITVQASDGSSGVKEVHYCKVENNSEPLINPETDPKADFNSEDSKYTFTLNKDKDENFVGNVIIYAIDNVGNNSFDNDIKTLSVNFDTQQCRVTSISVDKTDWTNEEVNLNVKIEDNLSGVKTDSVKYNVYPEDSVLSEDNWLEAKEKKDEDGTFTAVINKGKSLESGKYLIAVQAEDNAGNGSTIDETKVEVKYPLSVFIDNTAPVFNGDIKVDKDSWTNGKVTISGNVTDMHSDVSKVKYKRTSEEAWQNVDVLPDENGNFSFTVEAQPNEVYSGKYEIIAYDNAGGENTESSNSVKAESPEVKLDKTKPEVKCNYLKSEHVQKVEISGTATDTGSGVSAVKYRKHGESDFNNEANFDASTNTYSFVIESDYNGTYDIVAYDKADNISEIITTEQIFVDRTPPTIKVESTINKKIDGSKWTNSDILFSVKATDPENNGYASGIKNVEYVLFKNGSDKASSSGEAKYNPDTQEYEFSIEAQQLPKGGFNGKVVIYAKDKADNKSKENTTNIFVDTKTGQFGTITVNSNTWTNESVTVSGSVSDVISEEIQDKENISGIHAIKFKKVNEDEWKDVSTTEMGLTDNNKTADYKFTIEKQNYNGEYSIKYIDNAGNESETTFSVMMDETVPELTVENNDMTDWTKESVTFKGTVKDNLSGVKAVEYRHIYSDGTKEKWQSAKYTTNDNGLTGEYEFTLEPQDFSGYIEIHCIDEAGNNDYKSEDEITKRLVKMDISAPELTVKNIDMTDWTNEPVTFTGTVKDNLSGVKAVEYRHIYSDGTKEKWQSAEYTTKDNGLNGEFQFTLEPQDFSGYIEIYCIDGINITDYKSEAEITKRWVNMDITSPEIKVKHSEPISVWKDVLNVITFGAFNYNNPNANNLNYELTIKDNLSGINFDTLTMHYYKNGIEVQDKIKDIIDNSYLSNYSRDDNELNAYNQPISSIVKFTINDKLNINSHIWFTVDDNVKVNANSSTEAASDSIDRMIVDTIAPDKEIKYSVPVKTVNKETLKDVQSFNTVTDKNDTDKNLYYDGSANIRLRIKDANFYGEDINDNTNALKLKNVKDCKVTVDKNGKPWEFGNLVWHSEKDDWNYTDLTFEEDGEYVITMDYMDRSMNKMAQFKSATIIVDTTVPECSVSYSNKDVKNTIKGVKYFDKTQTATIKIIEKNFRADDVNVTVNAENSSENKVSVTDYYSYLQNSNNWKTVGDVHTATITYDKDANYTFDIEYQDLAKNSIADYSEDRFTVDRTAPQSVNISYSQSVLAKVVNAISFNYYNAPVTVDLSCYDETSGVYSFDYEGIIAADASAVNKAVVKTAIENAQITSANGTYTARFTIPQSALTALNSFNGTLTVDATDCSGNSIKNADSRRIVADNIAPTGSIELNTPSGTSGNVSYYSGNITGTFTINEANFYPEDVDFRIDGSVQSLSWSNSGDTHTASFTITSEGEHSFTLNYADRSGNKMNAITRNNLVIDKTIPSIVVDKSIKNTSANNAKTITFKLSVDDKYFDASGINAKLVANVTKASDENPDEKISKLVEEEVDLGSPSKVGTTYVYTIENISTDGFYTLTCTARDYAGNENSKISCTGSDDKTANVDGFNFSVNRNGSSFWVESSVDNNAYTNSDKISVALHEINVDEIAANAVLRIINDNETESVTLSDKNYSKNKKVGKTGWYESVYSLDNSYFEKDSEYSVTLTTHDRAGNISMNTDNELALVNFTVDRTAPIISSNIYSGQTIEAENYDVVLKIAENNLDKSTLKVFVGGESVEWKEDADNNSYSFNVEEKGLDEYTIVVEAKDLADNASEKYTVTGVRITNNKFILLILNPWFWIAVCAVLAGTGITVFIVISKRRKKAKEA